MSNKITKFAVPAVFVIVGILLFLFWAFPYRSALSYREQLQLFLTTGAYFDSLMWRPAGPATYAGEFLTQFFYNPISGGLVMSVMLTLLMLLCYYAARRFAPSAPRGTGMALAAIPALALLLFLGNPDVTMTYVTALVFVMAGVSATLSVRGRAAVYVLMFAFTALLYWLAGPAARIFSLLVIAYRCTRGRAKVTDKAVFSALALAWLAANVWAWSLCVTYPFSYQMIGLGYFMMPDKWYTGQVIVEALCVISPVMAVALARMPVKFALPALAVAEVAAAVILYPVSYNATTRRLINYDYMVRMNDWQGILEYSAEHDPDLPLTVSATNLAMGMTGRLDAGAFDIYQHGPEGLVPPFVKETLSSWTTGEIMFQLGLVNSARRFCFEGMEAIPNYNKSGRAIKRLAEAAIVSGDYALARKYLTVLENTLFYRNWARENLKLVGTPGLVEKHPVYGAMRRRMIDEDYMFSEGELDKTFGQLYLKDPGNSLAKQYLVVYPLLQRDLDKFAQYMGVVTEADPGYNPLLAQQAVAFISMKNGRPIPRGIVPPAVENSLRSFAQAWTSKDPSLLAPHRRTLYHYLLSDE